MHVFAELAEARHASDHSITVAMRDGQLDDGHPTYSRGAVAPILGFGKGDPRTTLTMVRRATKAERSILLVATQIRSLVVQEIQLWAALGGLVRNLQHHIEVLGSVRSGLSSKGSDKLWSSSSPPSAGSRVEGSRVAVWYGTTRKQIAHSTYLPEQGSHVSFGKCNILVPDRRSVGAVDPTLFERLYLGHRSIKVSSIEPMGSTAFWANLQLESQRMPLSDRHGLIYIHGFKTSFTDAARTSAQIKVDLEHKGPVAFFSWPSSGSLVGYSADEAAIEGNEAALKDFLTDFVLKSGVQALHIIAHSLGNRGLLRAANAIVSDSKLQTIRLGQIILAAPDVDTRSFSNLAAAYSLLSKRATLYASDSDRAIGLSRNLHNAPRVGLLPPVTITAGIDTIDASSVNTEFWGHSYGTGTQRILADIRELIRNDTPPSKRAGMKQVISMGKEHWKIQ